MAMILPMIVNDNAQQSYTFFVDKHVFKTYCVPCNISIYFPYVAVLVVIPYYSHIAIISLPYDSRSNAAGSVAKKQSKPSPTPPATPWRRRSRLRRRARTREASQCGTRSGRTRRMPIAAPWRLVVTTSFVDQVVGMLHMPTYIMFHNITLHCIALHCIMHTYMHACKHAYMHTYIHACIHTIYMHRAVCIHIYIYNYMYIYICTILCIDIYIYIYLHNYVHTYIYIYIIFMYTYIYIYKYVYPYLCIYIYIYINM